MPWRREFSRNEGGCSSCLEHGRCHGLCPYPGAGAGPYLGARFFGVGSKSGCFQRWKNTWVFWCFLATLLGVCVNRFWTTRFSTWLGEVSLSRLVAESKVNAPQKHNIFGFFLYTFVVLSAIAIFINSCCVQCPKCRCWKNKIIFRSKHRRLQPVRFFKNPPEIMQSYRVLQDTHYYILLTVGTGISVSGRFKNELSETQTRTFFVLHLFYFPSQWYVQRELVGMILKSRFGATEPPPSKKSLALESYGSHRWSMFLFPSKRELMEHITYSGNLNGVQTQPASSSGKDEPPPRKRMLYPLQCSISWGYLAGWFVV